MNTIPPERPPVRGAEIRFDGDVVARSDADGVAEIESDRAPERIEIVAPGWTLLGSPALSDGRLASGAREVVVWLTR